MMPMVVVLMPAAEDDAELLLASASEYSSPILRAEVVVDVTVVPPVAEESEAFKSLPAESAFIPIPTFVVVAMSTFAPVPSLRPRVLVVCSLIAVILRERANGDA
jgi:hypothetical protein